MATAPDSNTSLTITTVVGVPMLHASRDDIVHAIADTSDYLFADRIILELSTKTHLTMEVREHDPLLGAAFRAASSTSSLTDEDLAAIESHQHCVYLVDPAAGSVESVRRMARFVAVLLRIGGLGVKIESAGKAHSCEDWLDLAGSGEVDDLLQMFVALAGSDLDGAYSCGMHNLGWPDCATSMHQEVTDPGEVMWSFCQYLATEQPVLHSGHTFRVEPEGSLYLLDHRPSSFGSENLFHNPLGVWHLEAVPPS